MLHSRAVAFVKASIVASLLLLLTAASAAAALPRTYSVQRIDSPTPVTDARFGLSLVNVGDVNGDGEPDLLTGTDKHGAQDGQAHVISGETGAALRTYTLPDPDVSPGAGDRRAGFGNAVTKLADIGSCPGFAGAAGAICTLGAVGAPDGVPEHLVSASGVDVDANGDDLGTTYVFDGATGALLKRLLMPADDRAEQTAAGANDPRFGRTLLNPASDFPPTAPDSVKVGDTTGDGIPDILIGATDYDESKATAHPDSDCATQAGTEPCTGAGRVYLYSGSQIAGSDPAAPLATAVKIKNVRSQADDPTPPSLFSNDEAFGILLIPPGDAGACNDAAPAVGAICANARTPNNLDGRPDFVIQANGVDAFGFTDVGEALEFDGAKLTVIKDTVYPEPRIDSSWGIAQNGNVYPALGDLAGNPRPDFVVPDIQWSNTLQAQGRALVVNGDPGTNGSFREFPSRFTDPTPQNGEQFGASVTTLGDLTEPADLKNEVLIGAIGPHNPAPNPRVVNDVHIFDPVTAAPLQSIGAPDAQGGETFGGSLAPLGDLNEDGFQDFAVGAGLYSLTAASGPCSETPCSNAGRVYIFRSDNSAVSGGGAPGGGSGPAAGSQGPTSLAGCAAGKRLVAGTTGADRINGSTADDLIFGGTGNDTIDALAGNDCIDLGTGDDTGQGGLGNDLVLGGIGKDSVSGGDGRDRLLGDDGDDRLVAGTGNDTVFGGAGVDLVLGGFGDDRLHGLSGNDRINGGRGRDRINGGRGADRISGSSSADRISGDAGNDRLDGGGSGDVLKGNSGDDRLIGRTGRDSLSGGSGNDLIVADDSGRDRITCGRGRDTVIASRNDAVSRDCERVRRR